MSELLSATIITRTAFNFITWIATSIAGTDIITGVTIADFVTRRTTTIITTTSQFETFEKFSQ
jgi:hypothetical protein